MTEAWRVRSIERQQLLGVLMREVYRFEDEYPGHKMFKASWWLTDLIAKYLCSEPDLKQIVKFKTVGQNGAQVLFENSFLPKIKSFARSEIEANYLLAELSKKILHSASTPIYSALMHLEIIDPQLIFHASSAMAPMELPEEY